MISRPFAFLALAALVLSCGGTEREPSDSEQLGTSHAALCAGAPEVHGQYVTIIGCPFEQQAVNILKFGDILAPQMLLDADGESIATVTGSCDSWWLGKDASGLDVILDSDTGRVMSHGFVHPGLPLSVLPDQMSAPFTLAE